MFRSSAVPGLQRHCARALLGLGLVAVLGCDGVEKKPSAMRVAAQVNSDEITMDQIDAELARSAGVTPDVAPRTKHEILERLIDRQLAVQQALARKLDRSPEVLRALEAARAEVLAHAFADDLARNQGRPGAEEIRKYHDAHPELFAQRRVFVLEEVNLTAVTGLLPDLRDRVAGARSIGDVTGWLGSRGIKFSEGWGVRTAEHLPLQALARLQRAKDGEALIFNEGERIKVVRVVVSKPAPLDEATAIPRIGQHLFDRRASEALARQMKQMRDAADIQYQADFAAAAAKRVRGSE